MKTLKIFLLVIVMGTPALARIDNLTPSPESAAVYIISPKDGATVTSPVHIVFGLRNMGVAPAGVERENTGHHHLLIDHTIPITSEPMSNEAGLLHFGGGQTETMIELAPGNHYLQLILGDQHHIPHSPPVISDRITITVE